ncbi:NYN domain-containing protein [Commensalibacter nepenthis]|uniref:NYN domain-containing protein n=1 Tax=Commensalibacter nepenthis TaxID=3043872 RepID=A0ABT6Q5H3_9PROT|nr:NYN domain-containing protein [Commensalibacter sp. TBRC 10068]MDI2112149.1 NYN domain-containing protein [Commensalibacter sp. TBRC 10068]
MQISSRCAIFLDAGYIEYITRQEFPNIQINYEKLVTEITSDHFLFRTFYYNCLPSLDFSTAEDDRNLYEGKMNFFEALKFLPHFEVRLGFLSKYEDQESNSLSFHQKRVDILMVVDMMQLALTKQIDHLIIATGDGDLIPAIQAVKQAGVLVTLWHGSFRGKAAPNRELFQICDERYELGKIIHKIQKQDR